MSARTPGPPNEVERVKAASRRLRGTLLEGLADPVTGAIGAQDNMLLKFHGSYLQDDRDLREERRRQKLEPAFEFMIRVRLPGGVLSTGQWLALDALAAAHGNDTMRLTTRQTFQFHGIVKAHLKPAMQAIRAAGLDTIAACGDVNRNVISTANRWLSPAHAAACDMARDLSEHLLPKTAAFEEIWLDAPAADSSEHEPLYGDLYLPRKFKIAVAVPPSNDVDVYAHDLSFVAHVVQGETQGYTVLVGGGMGMTHGERATYPCLAQPMGYCTPDQVLAVAEHVLTTQRDFGDRSDRKHARLKYTVEDMGLDGFRAEVERRLGAKLAPAQDLHFDSNADPLGWQQTADGLWHYTLYVESGRIADFPDYPLRSALVAIMRMHQGPVCLTTNQNLTLACITPQDKPAVEALLASHGLSERGAVSTLRAHSMACVGLPTCGLSMAESERYLPDFMTRLEHLAVEAGLADVPFTVRISGCPNGCSRPYLAEVALVGKGPGKYNLYLGAGFQGQRLGKLLHENIGEADILAALAPLLHHYARERKPGEHFGDFAVRAGHIAAVHSGRDFHR